MTAAVAAPALQSGLTGGRLFTYLARALPGFDQSDAIGVQQFAGGQSNPTFLLETPARRYVLRKKPQGHLLPSAHAIEREYRLMRALAGHVPVPEMLLLCEDESIIGEPFYIMEHVEGRMFTDARMLDAPLAERRALSLELVDVLARLHRVDHAAAGLDDFGRSGGYIARQISRLSKQYASSRVEENADMDRIIAWLDENAPAQDEVSIVHGDYRSYNVLYRNDAPTVAAVLDWELATIGHPLADLAFCCLPYHMPADDPRGFHGQEPATLGAPSEAEMLERYCLATGRSDLPNWRYFLVFSLFRSAAIRASVYKRGFDGTAAASNALEAGRRYRDSAAAAANLIAA